jgi:hypothetical protein
LHPNKRKETRHVHSLGIMKRVHYKFEYLFKASPTILYQFLTDPSCLIRWFCDEVDVNAEVYTFRWGESEENAVVMDDFEEELFRLHWEYADSDNEHLDFKISLSDVTADTILHISDYCDANEVEDQKRYWDALITRLRAVCGG